MIYKDKSCENEYSDSKNNSETVENNITKVLSEQGKINTNAGNRKLAKNAVISYVNNILKYDLARAPFYIIGLEKDVKLELPISNRKVWIGGNIDRLDSVSGTYKIIDYKTGKHKDAPKSLEDLFDGTIEKRNNAVMQALYYSYIVSEKFDTNPQSELYYTRDIHTTQSSQIKVGKSYIEHFSDVKEEYIELLTEKLNELFNKDIAFTQTTVEKNCSFCDFKSICNKQV